ncbi:MAG: signal peptidase I [Myxococcota bacterium]
MWNTLLKITLSFALFLGGVGAVLHFFFVDRVIVGHNGMAPTVFAGDEVILWRQGNVEMGDVVLCQHPGNPSQVVLGRVYAKHAMTISTDRRGQISVANTLVDRDYIGETQFQDQVAGINYIMSWGYARLGNSEHLFFVRKGGRPRIFETKVNKGLFLLGDNLSNPRWDSRSFGEVDPESCSGSMFLRWKPSGTAPEEFGNGYFDLL